MDVVSDVLNNVLVRNNVTGLLRLRGDWAFDSPPSSEAVFHLVFRGSVWISFEGEPVRLDEGDMIMFKHGHGHRLASAPDAPSVTFAENDTRVRIHAVEGGQITNIDKQAGGPETSIICARFNLNNRIASDLVREFPDRAMVRGLGNATFAAFEPMLLQVATEAHSDEPGALAELDGLVNLLYMSFMRNWLTKASPQPPGWVMGLRDPQISKALQLMHSAPAKAWTVQNLATEVGMSRSNFAARFTEVTGDTPLRYLMKWRMSLAARQLEHQPRRPIGDIAVAVGYESEASFSTKFKKLFGKPPGVWRQESLSTTPQA